MFSLLLLLTTAFAQAPTEPVDGALPALTLSAPAATTAYTRYLTEPVTLVRWLGADATSGALAQGDAVEIVTTSADGMVRIRRGTDFGWVKASVLTETAPAAALPADVGAAP